MTVERRKHLRMPSFLGARIHVGYLNASYDCVVRNFSAGGGRIVLPGPVALPERFDLHIIQRDLLYRARIVWRDDRHVGVAFERPEQRDCEPVSLDQFRRIRRLEAQKKALQRRVEDLSGGA